MIRHWQIAIMLGLTAFVGATNPSLRADDDDDDDRWEERDDDARDGWSRDRDQLRMAREWENRRIRALRDEDDDYDDDGESRRDYRAYRDGAYRDREDNWDNDDEWNGSRWYSQRMPRHSTRYREDWQYVLPPNRAPRVYEESYEIEVSPRRSRIYRDDELPPPPPEPGYGRQRRERYDEGYYDDRYDPPRQHSYERHRLPPRYVEEPPSSVGARIGAQIGGLIGGPEGAQIGSSIGADVGTEVERAEWEREEVRRLAPR